MSAAALLGALAKITVVGFCNSWRIASMIVTVFPVPGLEQFYVRCIQFVSPKGVLTVQRR